MAFKIIGFISILFLAPTIALDWKGGVRDEFVISFDANKDPCTEDALESGFGIKYRFKVAACQAKVGWRSDCGKALSKIHDIKYDPVMERYKVTIDTLNDDLEPRSVTFENKDEALRFASTIDSVTIQDLQRNSPKLRLSTRSNDFFVRVRVNSECKGGFREALSWIPYLISFGIIDRKDYDSGWQEFNLR